MGDGEGPRTFKEDEVESHDSKKSLYLIIHGNVHDATDFVEEHPGGGDLLLDFAGQDATEAFEDVGHSSDAREILKNLLIGQLEGGEKPANGDSQDTKAASPPAGPQHPPLENFGYLVPFFIMVLYLWQKYLGFGDWVMVKVPNANAPLDTLNPGLTTAVDPSKLT